jgi:glycosyltransferase involved in cell wall biosynthesis
LAKAGYETYLIAPGDSFNENGVRVIGMGEKPKSRIKRMVFTARNVYRKALEIDADIYHFHDPELLSYGLRLKKRGKKVIYDVHEDYYQTILVKTWLPAPLRKIMAAHYLRMERRACAKLDAIVHVTPHQNERLHSGMAKTVMITNYPVTKDIKTPTVYAGGRKICFAGGITPQWLHERIISALPECGARYELAGRADGEYLSMLKSLEGWKLVNYRGTIPFEKVSTLMSECAVGMALLDKTGQFAKGEGTLGNTKLFEYMQNAIPVICTDFVLWKELIETEKCGIYVNIHDPDEIKKAISYLLDNPDEAEQMGKNGFYAATKKYNWKSQEEILLDLYRELENRLR